MASNCYSIVAETLYSKNIKYDTTVLFECLTTYF